MEQTLQGSELGSARGRARTEGQSQETQPQLIRAGGAFGTRGCAGNPAQGCRRDQQAGEETSAERLMLCTLTPDKVTGQFITLALH